jgi:hypothetical protein
MNLEELVTKLQSDPGVHTSRSHVEVKIRSRSGRATSSKGGVSQHKGSVHAQTRPGSVEQTLLQLPRALEARVETLVPFSRQVQEFEQDGSTVPPGELSLAQRQRPMKRGAVGGEELGRHGLDAVSVRRQSSGSGSGVKAKLVEAISDFVDVQISGSLGAQMRSGVLPR